MNRECEPARFANALEVPINGIGCKWSAAFGCEDEAGIRKLPAKLPQGPDFVTPQRVNARCTDMSSQMEPGCSYGVRFHAGGRWQA